MNIMDYDSEFAKACKHEISRLMAEIQNAKIRMSKCQYGEDFYQVEQNSKLITRLEKRIKQIESLWEGLEK